MLHVSDLVKQRCRDDYLADILLYFGVVGTGMFQTILSNDLDVSRLQVHYLLTQAHLLTETLNIAAEGIIL